MPAPRKQRIAAAAIVAALAVASLGVSVRRLAASFRGAQPASDFALLELSTDEATRGAQLLGPYSRFGWRHPGPAYFYWLAPFYRLSGGHSASLPVGVFILNCAALVAIAAALLKWTNDWPTVIVAILLAALYAAYLGPGFLYNIWNPAVTVLPLGVLLLLGAAIAIGRPLPSALFVAIASFLVQTHIGALACVAAVAAIAIAYGARRAASAVHEPGRPRRQMLLGSALAIVVLAVLWIPPLIEQATRAPGNMTRIVRFFAHDSAHHGLGEAMAMVAREIAWPWTYFLFGARALYEPHPHVEGGHLAVAALYTVGQLALLCAWSVRPRAGAFNCALTRVCLICTLVAVPAVMRIPGEIRPYLTTWISMIGALGALAALGPVASRLAARFLQSTFSDPGATRARKASGMALTAALAIAIALASRTIVRDSQFPHAASMSDLVVQTLRRRGVHHPNVSIRPSPQTFFAASAVLLQMHKRGVAFSVDNTWLNFFGARWQQSGAEDGRIDFYDDPGSQTEPPLICQANGQHQLCISINDSPRGRQPSP